MAYQLLDVNIFDSHFLSLEKVKKIIGFTSKYPFWQGLERQAFFVAKMLVMKQNCYRMYLLSITSIFYIYECNEPSCLISKDYYRIKVLRIE